METIFISSSIPEKSVSPRKQIKKPSGNYYSRTNFISRPNVQNLAPSNFIHGGLLFPPSLNNSVSFSGFSSASLASPFHRSYQEPQPPLLPLPVPKSIHNSLPSRTLNLSSSPASRKFNRNRDQSLTSKKSKTKKPIIDKGEERKKDDSKPTGTATTQPLSESLVGPLGPDPDDLPKDVSKVLSSSPSIVGANLLIDSEEFSGSVFSLAPPPSCLPLPKFSLRPKLSCNAEAAGIDAGATDDLRRLLRLC